MPSTAAHAPDRSSRPREWTLVLPRDRALTLRAGDPLVMGVLNLTPDSFSDGGAWFDPDRPGSPERAVARALEMIEQGADLLDLGAESTRPGGGVYGRGARTVPSEEELERLLPVLERVREATDAPLSVDTRKAAVAERALAAGADLINDVSALGDPAMAPLVAEAGCPVVLMHSRGDLSTMQRAIHFDDLLAEVRAELGTAVDRAQTAGIARERILVDPGLGFGKTAEQNLALLGGLPELGALGLPILVGASRKSFLGKVTDSPPERRLSGSLAAAARAAEGGAAVLRVHDVLETVELLAVWRAIGREARRELDRTAAPEGGEAAR